MVSAVNLQGILGQCNIGVLLWADMNAATPLGAWGRSVLSLELARRKCKRRNLLPDEFDEERAVCL